MLRVTSRKSFHAHYISAKSVNYTLPQTKHSVLSLPYSICYGCATKYSSRSDSYSDSLMPQYRGTGKEITLPHSESYISI